MHSKGQGRAHTDSKTSQSMLKMAKPTFKGPAIQGRAVQTVDFFDFGFP